MEQSTKDLIIASLEMEISNYDLAIKTLSAQIHDTTLALLKQRSNLVANRDEVQNALDDFMLSIS